MQLKVGHRIGMFSYGSGLASSLFSLRVGKPLNYLGSTLRLQERLDQRVVATPEEYTRALLSREQLKIGRTTGSREVFVPGTYYLDEILPSLERSYKIK